MHIPKIFLCNEGRRKIKVNYSNATPNAIWKKIFCESIENYAQQVALGKNKQQLWFLEFFDPDSG